MFKRLTGAAIALFALVSAPAYAASAVNSDCDLEMDSNYAQWRVDDIDAFSADPRTGTFELQLVNSGNGECKLHLNLNTAGAPFGLTANGSQRVPYQIYDHDTGKNLTPNVGNSVVQFPGLVQVARQGTRVIRLDVVFLPQFQTDGTYSQTLTIEAQGNGSNDVFARRSQPIVAVVASSATMSLSGNFTRNNGIADVDLGMIDGPQAISVPLILKIRSTRAYRIRSSSENQGKLALSGTNWRIPYRLSIAGISVDPAGGFYNSAPGTNKRLDNLALGFSILGGENVAAGRYSDLITLEVSVN